MNIIDLSVIGLIVLFGVIGVVRGLVTQLFSLGGLIAGHMAGVRHCASVASVLKFEFRYAEPVGYLIVLTVIFIAVVIAGSFISDKIRGTRLSPVNRLLGLFAGLLKGGLLAALLVFVLIFVLPQDAEALRKSITVPYAVAAGEGMAEMFPPRISDSFKEKLQAVEKRPPGVCFFGK